MGGGWQFSYRTGQRRVCGWKPKDCLESFPGHPSCGMQEHARTCARQTPARRPHAQRRRRPCAGDGRAAPASRFLLWAAWRSAARRAATRNARYAFSFARVGWRFNRLVHAVGGWYGLPECLFLCNLQRPGHFNGGSRACKFCGGKLTQHCPGRCEVRMPEVM